MKASLFILVLSVFICSNCFGKVAGMLVDKSYNVDEIKAVESLKYAFSDFYEIEEISYDNFCVESILEKFDVILIPNGHSLPINSMEPVKEFVAKGGDLVVLNSPMWQEQLIKVGQEYISRDKYQDSLLNVSPDNIIFDFSKEDISKWKRGNSDKESGISIVLKEDTIGKYMQVDIEKLQNYDTLNLLDLDNPFKNGASVIEVVAKGDENTGELVVECMESDSSRWFSIIPIDTTWKRYFIQPENFTFWDGPAGRGERGKDRLKIENAVAVSVGMALSHIPTVGEGQHSYAVAEIGTSVKKERHEALLAAKTPVEIDTLAPAFKVFDCNDVGVLSLNKEQSVIENEYKISMPDSVSGISTRQQGHGFDKRRNWRFINIIEAYSFSGEWRGIPASMKIYAKGENAGSVLVSFAPNDMKWYSTDAVKSILKELATSLDREIFFLDAGADNFTYFENQEVKVGANIINLGKEKKSVDLNIVFSGDSKYDFSKENIVLEPKSVTRLEETIPDFSPADNFVTASIVYDGKVIDRVYHNTDVWIPKENPDFVTVKEGNFYLNGKIFKPYGVNFVPTSGSTNEGLYFNHYVGAEGYDPEVVERDIKKFKELGFNSVSIFIFEEFAQDQNMLDMLCLLDKYDMKASVSLRPGTPFDIVADSAEKIIKAYKLWDNDVIFAYDIAWEPSYGNWGNREWFDPSWERWIIEQYGSIESAESDWEYPVPRREGGRVTNPSGHDMIYEEGPHSRMVLAYKRFLDYFLYKTYNEARRRVKEIDPNHLVSFRMAETSNPNYSVGEHIVFDFNYLVSAVDFLGPEAYGRFGNAERVKPGRFVKEYGRWAASDYPLIWPEAGATIWDNTRMKVSKKKDLEVAEFYELFYEMLIESGSQGAFFWYSCPGFRIDEKSDFGIFNEDFTDRELTKVIRKYSPLFLNAPDVKPSKWIEMDFEYSSIGLSDIYSTIEDEFYSIIEDGENPGLKTEATGSDTDTIPLIAVGNVPYNQNNPLKYVDGAFEYVSINGTRVGSVPVIYVPSEKDVVIKAKFCNLNEATWKSDGKNPVVLFAIDNKTEKKYIAKIPYDLAKRQVMDLDLTIPNIPAGEHEFTLRFAISNKAYFGEKMQVKIIAE